MDANGGKKHRKRERETHTHMFYVFGSVGLDSEANREILWNKLAAKIQDSSFLKSGFSGSNFKFKIRKEKALQALQALQALCAGPCASELSEGQPCLACGPKMSGAERGVNRIRTRWRHQVEQWWNNGGTRDLSHVTCHVTLPIHLGKKWKKLCTPRWSLATCGSMTILTTSSAQHKVSTSKLQAASSSLGQTCHSATAGVLTK